MSRRAQIEKLLDAQPNDPFLLYGLAMEDLKDGNAPEGIRRLESLIALNPDYQAAYFQLAQALVEQGDIEPARTWLAQGIEAARRAGDMHAAEEMAHFLESL